MTESIQWPAMIKYGGDDELIYIHDQQEWLSDDDLSQFGYAAGDLLVDSTGRAFSLQAQPADRVEPVSTNEEVSPQQATEWIRNHFSVSGACCISKIHANSVAECLQMLQQDRDS